MANWFISDLHFGHYNAATNRGIITFERTRFETIQEHDAFIIKSLTDWAKTHQGETLWILGDFGYTDNLWVIKHLRDNLGVIINFILGNHDKHADMEKFQAHFDNVYDHPVYIANRVVLSHEPIWPCPAGTLNVHGHLHSSHLDSAQHINCSIHDVNYRPVSEKAIYRRFSKIEKPSYKFLEEPFADKYIFDQPREDVVYNENGLIDVRATKVLRKLQSQK